MKSVDTGLTFKENFLMSHSMKVSIACCVVHDSNIHGRDKVHVGTRRYTHWAYIYKHAW